MKSEKQLLINMILLYWINFLSFISKLSKIILDANQVKNTIKKNKSKIKKIIISINIFT